MAKKDQVAEPQKQLPAFLPSGSDSSAPPSSSGDGQQRALPVDINQLLMEDSRAGMESMDAKDFAIPRLSILQDLSPQVKKTKAEYIEGAAVGMIYNPVTGDLYDGEKGLLCLCVSYRRSDLQWWPRNSDKGRGFIADLGPNSPLMAKTFKGGQNGAANMLHDGSEIVTTGEYFSFILDEETWDGTYNRALISLSKSQLIKAKKLNAIASELMIDTSKGKMVAPLFYRSYRFSTGPQEDKKGNTWIGWNIKPGPVCFANTAMAADVPVLPAWGQDLYLQARAYRLDVEAGKVKVAPPVATDNDAGMGGAAGANDDAPM